VIVIYSLSRLVDACNLAAILQIVCLIQIIINSIGLYYYNDYIPPLLYNISFALLYAYVAIILTKGVGYGIFWRNFTNTLYRLGIGRFMEHNQEKKERK